MTAGINILRDVLCTTAIFTKNMTVPLLKIQSPLLVDLDSYAEGLQYCFQGLKLAEKTGDKRTMMLLLYHYAGYFYMAQSQYAGAITMTWERTGIVR
jgi:hypothetical protein